MIRIKPIIFFAVIFLFLLLSGAETSAQCSICTKTAQQMGEGPAKALNMGIVYLMLTPFAVVGFIVYRWWKNHKS
ncbi:MAG: hypothetical protein QM763_22100 [Agriterribacter sp.]